MRACVPIGAGLVALVHRCTAVFCVIVAIEINRFLIRMIYIIIHACVCVFGEITHVLLMATHRTQLVLVLVHMLACEKSCAGPGMSCMH